MRFASRAGKVVKFERIMRKKLPKILIVFFIAVFILQMAALLFLLIKPVAAVEFTPQVGIGNDFQAGVAKTVGGDTIAKYIKAIYQYGVGVIGILAAVILMFGGVLWLTAGGNTGQVSEAKEWIKASLTGLIIALLSYIILLTVNPDLVNLKPITVEPIDKITGSNSGLDLSKIPPADSSKYCLWQNKNTKTFACYNCTAIILSLEWEYVRSFDTTEECENAKNSGW